MGEPNTLPEEGEPGIPLTDGARRPWAAPKVTFEETLEAVAGVCETGQGGKGDGSCTFLNS